VMGHGTYLFLITPWLVDILRVSDIGLSFYYLFLVAAIVASFVWMLKKSLHKFGHELTFQVAGHAGLGTEECMPRLQVDRPVRLRHDHSSKPTPRRLTAQRSYEYS